MTAYHLKVAEPSLQVALLEAKTIGYGASGRNGSFAMTVVGLGFDVTPILLGKQRFQAAHRYMMRAVDEVDRLILTEKIECDRIRPGFLRMATTKAYIKRLKHQVERMNTFGFEDIYWIGAPTGQLTALFGWHVGAAFGAGQPGQTGPRRAKSCPMSWR
jgi:glycine/D-amino acid oxidase-like deaminating enzyme